MSDPSPDTRSDDRRHNFETRVAIDVMFEALSHIQASIDASTEEERVKSYRKFKEALYERYEHLLEKRRAERADVALETVNGNGHTKDQPAKEEGEANNHGGDTLGKLWPTISDKSKTFDA